MASAHPIPVDPTMYTEQRQRLAAKIKSDLAGADDTVAALISGEPEVERNYSDCTFLFRQNGYFMHLFGYNQPDAFGAVLASGKGVLFIARLPESYATWMGPLPTPETVKAATGVDECFYADEIPEAFAKLGVKTVHVMNGTNSDSGRPVTCRDFPNKDKLAIKDDFLFEALNHVRVFKTKKEIELMSAVNKVSSLGHVASMQASKPGLAEHVYEATFMHYTYLNGGQRDVSYGYICASGPRCAILHYPGNDQPIKDGEMALLDMGGTYHGYASDITTSFPVNGKFTELQKGIYNAVLEANDAVKNTVKPGVNWVDMQKLALKTIAKHLIALNVLKGSVEDIMKNEVMALFMPHGLGHMIGIDVHDVGGYPAGGNPRPEAKDCCRLRTARDLDVGQMITCEPGCYFNQVLLEQAFAGNDETLKSHLNEDVIRKDYWNFGGVRIEDDIVITPDGILNMTCVPRTVEEIEAVMAGGAWEWKTTAHKN